MGAAESRPGEEMERLMECALGYEGEVLGLTWLLASGP